MKRIYLAIQITKNGKHYAFADAIRTGENLKTLLQRYDTNILLVCESRAQAEGTVTKWNGIYKENGEYLFDSHNFKEVDQCLQ